MCQLKAQQYKKMTKLVIFDLDGTLIDTKEDIADACNHALEVCGYPTRRLEEFNMLVGRGVANMLKGALPEEHRNEVNLARIYQEFVPYYNEHICDKTLAYPGIYDLLDRLSAEGIALAVASNKYQAGTELLIEKLFGKYSFVSILGQREGKPIKPDPQIVYDAMSNVEGITLDDIIYCGDSDVDMQTGLNAGVKTVGVTWGFRTKEELEAYSPWMLVDKADEISKAILG